MDDYKGLADSDAVRALADQLSDPGGVRPVATKPPEPSNGTRKTHGKIHPAALVALYRASIGTIIAVVSILAYNKLNGETLKERARADAMATLVDDQARLADRWEALAEHEAREREKADSLQTLTSAKIRSYVSLARLAIGTDEEIDAVFVLGGLGDCYYSIEFMSDQELVEEYTDAVRQLLESLETKD